MNNGRALCILKLLKLEKGTLQNMKSIAINPTGCPIRSKQK